MFFLIFSIDIPLGKNLNECIVFGECQIKDKHSTGLNEHHFINSGPV